jgi:hypothetical protein
MEIISGFSKLSKSQKLAWLAKQVADNQEEFIAEFESYLHRDVQVQNSMMSLAKIHSQIFICHTV